MLDLHRLYLLRELQLRGTIAAVAAALDYTPSAISQQLATLEREAGCPLLRRTGRTVQLTEAGRILVGHAEVILARVEQARADLAVLDGQVTGELRIGAYPSAMSTVVTPALVRLSQDQPRLRVRVTEIDPARVPAAVRTGRLDVALLHTYDCLPAHDDPSVDTEPLFDEAVLLATAADGPGALDDCAAHPRISGTVGTLCDSATTRMCENAGFSPRIRHRTDDFAAVLALVAAGQGVALVPTIATTAASAAVRLHPVGIRRRTALAYRRGAASDPLVEAARQALRSR